MVDVGGALGRPHDIRDDDHLPWHSSCACGAFLSLLEHYGWCSSRILVLVEKMPLTMSCILFMVAMLMRGCLSMKSLVSWRLLMHMMFGRHSCLYRSWSLAPWR